MAAPHPTTRPQPIEYAIATVGYAVAACLLLYPIFTRGGGEIYSPAIHLERPIASWVMWILAWDVHALTSAAELFNANVFYPAPNTLVFGDPLLGLIPFFAPPYLLTGDPVVSYQVTLLTTFAMCGAGMYYLARHWGAGIAAAAIAGLIYAVCPARIAMMAQLAYLSCQFLPLALVFIDRTAQKGRFSDAALLFLFAAWQLLSGTQLAYASMVVLAAYVLVFAITSGRTSSSRGLALTLAAIAAALGVFALSTAPYRSLVDADMIAGKTMRDFALFGSANAWRIYLIPPPIARALSVSGGGLYLGLAVLALAFVGAIDALVRRRQLLLLLLVTGAACYAMSLGPDIFGITVTPYNAALDHIPGFEMLGPAPSRFALFMMIPIAALAAFGTDRLRSVTTTGRAATTVAVAITALVLIDYRLPLQGFETQRLLHRADEIPLYATLAELPPGPVLELPITPCSAAEFTAATQRQLASTLHWNPLLDGYQSHDHAPATYSVVRAIANALPDARALQTLRRATRVRYLVVHLTELRGSWRHRWRSLEGVTRLGFFGHDLLFEVQDQGKSDDGDLMDELLGLPQSDKTLTGVETRLLDESQRGASLGFTALPQQTVVSGNTIRAEVIVENRSQSVWPALTTNADRRVHVSYLWTDASGTLTGGNGQAQPLPLDLGPGESVVVPVCVEVPRVMGEVRLAFGLTQADQWFADLSEQIPLHVIP